MSWLFSRALVEASLGESSSGGKPCAPLNLMPTQHPFLRNGKTTDFSKPSLFGLTLEVLTAARGEELLMSFLRASLARTSARPSRGRPASKASTAVYGARCQGSFARFDRETSSWRTAQYSLLGGLALFSETWPSWGFMLDGECSALTVPAWTTPGKESGLLPTPLASDHKGGHSTNRAATPRTLSGRPRAWRDYVRQEYGLTYPHPMHSELRMGWPIGWTDLKPLETDRFQQWKQWHINYLPQ